MVTAMSRLQATVLLLLAVLGAIDAQAQTQRDWLEEIAGRYLGHLVEGATEQPVVTILRKTMNSRSNSVLLNGEYTFRDERIAGKLEGCVAVRVRLLKCTWIDRFGRGPLELEFDETLTSFKGRWSSQSRPGFWFPWNGRITPQT